MSWLKYSSAAPFDPLAEKHPLLDNEGEGEEGGREGSRGIVITFTHTHTNTSWPENFAQGSANIYFRLTISHCRYTKGSTYSLVEL